MVDRLLGQPNADDPELPQRARDPLLSSLRDDLATRAATGRRVVIPTGAKYEHRLDRVALQGSVATVNGCDIDDSVTVGPSGETLDDSIVTRTVRGTFSYDGTQWVASDLRAVSQVQGIAACAG
jgi:hypothetical protein